MLMFFETININSRISEIIKSHVAGADAVAHARRREGLQALYDECTRLAETRLAQNSLNCTKVALKYLKIALTTLRIKLSPQIEALPPQPLRLRILAAPVGEAQVRGNNHDDNCYYY